MDIAYDPVNHRMYVTNYSDDTVSSYISNVYSGTFFVYILI